MVCHWGVHEPERHDIEVERTKLAYKLLQLLATLENKELPIHGEKVQ